MDDRWRDSYDTWKLATPPEYEISPEEEDDLAIARSTMSRQEEAQLQARLQRFRDALEKIAKGWPCEDAKHMRLVARDALGSN